MLILAGTGHAVDGSSAREADEISSTERSSYEEIDCWFHLDAFQRDGRAITCGRLTVPENWHEDQSQPIDLPIVTFGARGGQSTGEPIIFLVGGPVQRAMLRNADAVSSFWIESLRNQVWARRRDVIVITPRGANWTNSNLDCPELYDPRVALGASGRWGSQVHWTETYFSAYFVCIERLKLMHDLDGYTLDQMAADVLALREQLRLDAWSLMGVSFGTRLALEVMRGEPDGLQTVVLDSVSPPGGEPIRDVVTAIDGALKKVNTACASDPPCHRDYPDLKRLPTAALEHLRSGYTATLTDNDRFGTVHFSLLPSYLWLTLFEKLNASDLIGTIPAMLAEMAAGEFGSIVDTYRAGSQQPHVVANAAFELVNCNLYMDDLKEFDGKQLRADFPIYEELIAELENYFSFCDDWPLVGQNEQEETAVTSSVPTLLLAGNFDVATPPDDAEHAAKTLENGHLFIFENQAHSVLFSSLCAADVTTAFLRDPSVRPEAGCSSLDRKISFQPRNRKDDED